MFASEPAHTPNHMKQNSLFSKAGGPGRSRLEANHFQPITQPQPDYRDATKITGTGPAIILGQSPHRASPAAVLEFRAIQVIQNRRGITVKIAHVLAVWTLVFLGVTAI